MGSCITKKKSNPQNPGRDQPPAPQEVSVNNNSQALNPQESPQSANFLIKVIPDQAKIYLYSLKAKSAYTLPVSVPFKFHKACAVCDIGNDLFMIVGGYEEEEDEMSKDCIIFDINTLSGMRIEDCPVASASGSLIYEAQQRKVYLLGGMVSKLNDSNFDEFCDFKGSDFCCFDLNTRTWNQLENCPKQYCLPTCYLKGGSIYVCGGFSSIIHEESRFVKRSNVYIYELQRKTWKLADYDFPVANVGSVAVNYGEKTLILGGMVEYNSYSTKVFSLTDKQVSNLRDFNIPNMIVLSPGIIASGFIYFLAEPDMLLTYDIKSAIISHQSLLSLHPPIAEYFSNKIGKNPRSAGIYVYLAECAHKVLRDFNVISQDTSIHSLKNIQYRDGGMLVMSDGKLFFAGGVGASTSKSTNLCFIYDPITHLEKEAAILPSPLRGLRLVENQGVIYAVSGHNESSEKPQDVTGYCYLIDLNEWRKLNNMMHATRYPCCFVLKNDLYAIGGEELDEMGEEVMVHHVQAMDFESKVWTSKVVTYPHKAKSMGCLSVSNASVLIFGGEDEEGQPLQQCYLFNGEEFERKSDLPEAFSTYIFENHGIVYEGNGYIYSNSGVLFKVDLTSFEWSETQVEQEFTNRV